MAMRFCCDKIAGRVDDPPLQPAIDKYTEQLGKPEVDRGSHEPSGTQGFDDNRPAVHEMSAATRRQTEI